MKRGIYIVPSLFTLANLAAGMMSILFSANYRFSSAAWAIIVGIVMDMLDGRIARWAGATSQFGLELDSLCDVVTFGIGPAVLIYQVALSPMGRPGYAIAIFFAMAAALRLARFNLRARTAEPTNHFLGLPVPGAAGIVASFVLSYELFGDDAITAKTIPLLMERMPVFYRLAPFVMMMLAFLMVSPVQYSNFKQLKLGRPKSVQNLALLLAGILLIFAYPQNMIFIVFSLYVLSGLIALAWRFYHAQRAKRFATPGKWGRRATDRQAPAEQEALTISGSEPWNQRK